MDWIRELKRTPTLKFEWWEWRDLYRNALAIKKMLKKKGGTYHNPEQRIMIRNEINLALRIYDKEYCIYEKI